MSTKKPTPRWENFQAAKSYVETWFKTDWKKAPIEYTMIAICNIYCVTKNNLIITRATDYSTAIASAEWMEFPRGVETRKKPSESLTIEEVRREDIS